MSRARQNLLFVVVVIVAPLVVGVVVGLALPADVGYFISAMVLGGWYPALAWSLDQARVEYFTHHWRVMQEEEEEWYWEL